MRKTHGNGPQFFSFILLCLILASCRPPDATAPEQSPVVPQELDEETFVRAVVDRDQEVIAACLEAGLSPNSRNKYGDTVLSWAVARREHELVKTLLERGADTNLTGSYGKSALHWACKQADRAMAETLIQYKAEINRYDDNLKTPLMTAAERGHAGMVRLLIDHNVDLDLTDREGKTALYFAVQETQAAVVEALTLSGARLETVATSGETALTLAVKRDRQRLFLTPAIRTHLPDIEQTLSNLEQVVIANLDQKPELDLAVIERRVHELVNQERQKVGLVILGYDERLAAIARGHSLDMGENNFFNHINLNKEDPTRRAIKVDYDVTRPNSRYGIGENIYRGSEHAGSNASVEKGVRRVFYNWLGNEEIASRAVIGWMNSDGHRRNILSRSYVREGIGIFKTDDGKIYITQNFF